MINLSYLVERGMRNEKLHTLRNTSLFWKVYYFLLYQIFRNSNHLFSISDRNSQALHQFGDRSICFSSMISPLPLHVPETRSNLPMLPGRGIAGNTLCDMYNLRFCQQCSEKVYLHHIDNNRFLGTCQWPNR